MNHPDPRYPDEEFDILQPAETDVDRAEVDVRADSGRDEPVPSGQSEEVPLDTATIYQFGEMERRLR